jgi:SNF2 family DNA or RNA helicase
MQLNDKEIIERVLGHNNYEMWQKCELLKKVINTTIEVKEGRGKNVRITNKYKHNVPTEVRQKILDSCDYYKELMKTDKSQIDAVIDVLNAVPIGTIQLRDYQIDIIEQGTKIIQQHGFVYLAMEVRCGKTLTSLGIASKISSSNVLFLTKKKAISSIQGDYKLFNPSYHLTVINYESLHKIDTTDWDLIICDEAHSMGAFAKPSKRAIQVKDLIAKTKARIILLSGTPTPESYSQMYHQVYGIPNNPFRDYKNFYKFCSKFVNVKTKMINGLMMNDYSDGMYTILEAMNPFTINYTQAEAGFVAKTTEEVFEVELKESTYKLINKLKRDLVIEGKEEVILGDTPVKLMSKMHQLYSGTIKFESGKSMVLDTTKAEFIKQQWEGCQIGIFYKFKEELVALQEVFGDELTTDLDEFNATYKNIALQIVSGREGISLKKAEYLVYYNIDFSATSYWQSKDRMTTKERLENQVFWIFSKGGIEHDIYKAVSKKKNYTLNHFKKLL